MVAPPLKTKRLLLRHFKEEDLVSFSAMNADPKVMEFFPAPLTKEQSDALAKKIQTDLKKKNYGLWAVEIPSIAPFIGFIGLNDPDFSAHFTPCIEIGWRLAFPYWGKGYATEGALTVKDYAFNQLGLKQLVSFCAKDNWRSRHVMEKIGMKHDPKDDFEHPKLPPGHPLRAHVLYRISKNKI